MRSIVTDFLKVCLPLFLIAGHSVALAQVPSKSCNDWIDARPKGNWQNPEQNTPAFEQSSVDCIRDLQNASETERLALLDRYLLSALNIMNPADLAAVSSEWSDAARLKVNAVRVPFILSPFVPDSASIEDWLVQSRESGDDHARARFAYYYGFYRTYATDEKLSEEESAALFDEAIEAGQRAGGMRIGFFALRQKAISAKQAGDLAGAVALLTEIIAETKAPRLNLIHLNALSDLAYLFYEIGDQERSIALYDRAIASTDRYPLTIGQTYLNRALALRAHDDFDEAEKSARQAIARFVEHTENNSTESAALPGLYNARFELARIQYQKGEAAPEPILASARRAAESLYEADYFTESVHAEAFAWLGEAYLEQGRVADARSMLDKAEEAFGSEIDPDDISPDDQDRAFMLPYLRSVATLLRRLGDYEESSKYAAAALALSEQRFEKEKLRAVGNADLIFSLEEQEERAQLMARTAELATVQSERNLSLAILAALLTLATLVAAFSLYRAYRTQRHAAKTKDMFLSEMHHRLANNLQTLLSLFRIEARREEVKVDNATGRARKDAVLRLRTMGLLHEKLRSRQSGTTISARAFFSDLRDMLDETLGKDEITLKGEFDDFLLEADKAVPLGLLASELVTNSYKHGFDDAGGVVEIRLTADGRTAELTVCDDGVGFSEEADKSAGIGMSLIVDLAAQTGGVADRSSPPEGTGTKWTVSGVPLAA
ncbi:MAG: histidine kinase dimerization/phosphoacceptor domain -containing protein [Pseudomonadota bacterium]